MALTALILSTQKYVKTLRVKKVKIRGFKVLLKEALTELPINELEKPTLTYYEQSFWLSICTQLRGTSDADP